MSGVFLLKKYKNVITKYVQTLANFYNLWYNINIKIKAKAEGVKMSNFSEYMKSRKENDMKFFYGETEKKSNKYFYFKRVQDEDNIILLTDNIKFFKGSPVLVVAENKVVYLKVWQIRNVHNYHLGVNTYAVKLNRNYFKKYTLSFVLDDFAGKEEDDFDSLKKIAAEQDEANMPVADGWAE